MAALFRTTSREPWQPENVLSWSLGYNSGEYFAELHIFGEEPRQKKMKRLDILCYLPPDSLEEPNTTERAFRFCCWMVGFELPLEIEKIPEHPIKDARGLRREEREGVSWLWEPPQ